MKKISILLLLIGLLTEVNAQENGFPFGKFTYRELEMTDYPKDTSAQAVVLNEFGEAHIQNDGDLNLELRYHVKIKILKPDGLSEANFRISLHKQEGREERLKSVEASTFTMVNGSAKESKFDGKTIYTENRNKYWDIKKFTLPNVQVGSVIEVMYVLESPFIFNFRTWEFQSDLPKVVSEYWATIPGNYVYNITLKGFYKLDSNNSEVISDCFTPGGGRKADCVRYKFVMKDIPSFTEEEYMTAASNFESAINFELSEVKYFDGRVDKITKEWKDADIELQRDPKFGVQLKRGKDIVDNEIETVIVGDNDELSKAKKVYTFIKDRYQWDEIYGKYSEFGIKKAFDSRKGNVGDINISLIAALKYAKLNVEPLILSTRDNGFPIDIHPVLSDFNYVIAKLTIGDKIYLLDATEKDIPFGILPLRCLNGKGRAINSDKESYWYDIKATEKRKSITVINLKIAPDGLWKGTIMKSFIGYSAITERRKIKAFSTEADYVKSLNNRWIDVTVKDFTFSNVDDIDKPLSENFEVEIVGFDNANARTFYLNPFLVDRWEKNPFKSSERLYPVDFGAPLEEVMILNLELPENMKVSEVPPKIGLALPNNGGRYIYEAKPQGNRVIVNHSLLISKSLYSSEEYHYLKELFSNVIQAQNADLVFIK